MAQSTSSTQATTCWSYNDDDDDIYDNDDDMYDNDDDDMYDNDDDDM